MNCGEADEALIIQNMVKYFIVPSVQVQANISLCSIQTYGGSFHCMNKENVNIEMKLSWFGVKRCANAEELKKLIYNITFHRNCISQSLAFIVWISYVQREYSLWGMHRCKERIHCAKEDFVMGMKFPLFIVQTWDFIVGYTHMKRNISLRGGQFHCGFEIFTVQNVKVCE